MPDMLGSISTLRELGFSLAGLFPVTRTKDLCVIEFDGVFVNTKATGASGSIVTKVVKAHRG